MSDEPTKIMFVMRKPPHGSIYAYEGLEVVLIAAAYEQDVSMMFIGDGVLSLKKGQDTTELGIKGFMKTFGVLDGYDVEKLYVEKKSLTDRGLTADDLVVDVIEVDTAEAMKVMKEQDTLFPF